MMATTAPTQSQQGVTKTLSGPNAVFKDKVYNFCSGAYVLNTYGDIGEAYGIAAIQYDCCQRFGSS